MSAEDPCERCGTPLIFVEGMGLTGWWERIGETNPTTAVLIEHTPDRCTIARGKNVGTPCLPTFPR